jgi:transposase
MNTQQEKLNTLRSAYRQLKKKERKTNVDVREMMRLKALIAYYQGIPIHTIAKCYGVSLKSLRNWVKKFETNKNLADQPRSGRPPKLSPEQISKLKAKIAEDNQRIWTARHIYLWLKMTFSICLSTQYLPELLRSLGLSYHKAMHILYKKNGDKRKIWIQETLPALHAQAVKEGWRLFYADETGFQTEGTLAYSWGMKGERIEVKNYGRHGRVNLIGALEFGTGDFYGVLTTFKVKGVRFQRFLCHLKHEMRHDKLLLIVDNASFHKAKWLQQWYQAQQDWLRIEFLPAYSPDFNPIERLWQWLKEEYAHNRCWDSQAVLKKHLQQMLKELPHRVTEIKGCMRQEMERFKNIFEAYETPFPFTMPT